MILILFALQLASPQTIRAESPEESLKQYIPEKCRKLGPKEACPELESELQKLCAYHQKTPADTCSATRRKLYKLAKEYSSLLEKNKGMESGISDIDGANASMASAAAKADLAASRQAAAATILKKHRKEIEKISKKSEQVLRENQEAQITISSACRKPGANCSQKSKL